MWFFKKKAADKGSSCDQGAMGKQNENAVDSKEKELESCILADTEKLEELKNKILFFENKA